MRVPSAARRANRRDAWRRRVWLAYLLIGLAIVLAGQLAARQSWPVVMALQSAGVLTTVFGVLRRRPGAPLGWWLTVGARLALIVLTTWSSYRAFVAGVVPGTDTMGLSSAAQYVLFVFGGALLLRRRRAGSGAENAIEVGIVVMTLAMLAWTFVVEPYLAEPTGRQVGTGIAALYALIDLGILAMVLRSRHAMARTPGLLLGGAGLALLTAHLIYALSSGSGAAPFLPGGAPYLFGQVFGVLLSAAGLHPAARRLGRLNAADVRLLSRAKLIAYMATAVISPMLPVLATPVLVGHGDPSPVPALMIACLGGLLMARIWLLVRLAQQRAEQLDTQAATLRRSLADQATLQRQLAHRALHDPLTGLANRSLLHERLHHAAGEDEPYALLLCDLDGFKDVNDTYGHPVGDQTLVQVGERLLAVLSPADTLARLGGDEFAVLLTPADERRAARVAAQIIEAVAEPIDLGQRRLHLTTSVGLVPSRTDDTAPSALLRDADLALYAAKHEGKDRVVRFSPRLREEQLDRARIAAGLRSALADDQLRLHYQPVIDLDTGRVEAVEALMRWTHNDSPVPPTRFIAVAEQTGLITALGTWALREACRTTVPWHRDHGVYVAVNVSGRQLREPDFAATVLAALRETGLPPAGLVLELTETVFIDATDAAIAHLRTLRAGGVRIAVDDFGTGYSSLAYLNRLPVDILKIDRAFVGGAEPLARPAPAALTRAIVELSLSLGLTAVAEGVETAAQADLLRALRCPLAQGYHFSRPVPAAQIEAVLGRPDPVALAA